MWKFWILHVTDFCLGGCDTTLPLPFRRVGTVACCNRARCFCSAAEILPKQQDLGGKAVLSSALLCCHNCQLRRCCSSTTACQVNVWTRKDKSLWLLSLGVFLEGRRGWGRLFILNKRYAMAVGKEPDFGQLLNITGYYTINESNINTKIQCWGVLVQILCEIFIYLLQTL